MTAAGRVPSSPELLRATGRCAGPASPPARMRRGTVAASAVYLAVAIAVWWPVWSTHPTSVTTCGCGDAARFIWFFEWPVAALAHGHNLFFSPSLFHPTGINLLNDTSVLLAGVVLSPVTAVFGPVAAMNVALTLAPVLSSAAMYVLLRRWVRLELVAFVGGLLYGLSPFAVTELAYNQLNFAVLAVPPLAVGVLHDLLAGRRRSPTVDGALLALLGVVEFFLSTELLLVMAMTGAAALVVLAGWSALRSPETLRSAASRVARGLVVAAVLSAAVLAYPLWFWRLGPAHLSGPIWSNGGLGRFGTTVAGLVHAQPAASLAGLMRHFGGYQGAALPNVGYLGSGAVAVAAGSWSVWRHDRRLQCFGALAMVAGVLSLGPGHGWWVPWQALEHVPLVGDIIEVRFTVVSSLCLAAMVAIAADRCAAAARRRGLARWGVALAAGAVLAVAVVPDALAVRADVPLRAVPVVVPDWYRTVGARLPPGQVVLAYPAPFSGLQSAMAWQAIDGMRFAMAGGGGPEGQLAHAGPARRAFTVLSAASLPLGPLPHLSAADVAAVHHALVLWGVTMVVVPDQRGLPGYASGRGPAFPVTLFTAALGTLAHREHAAWVWRAVGSDPGPLTVAPATVSRCAGQVPRAAGPCVLAAAGRRSG